MALILVLFSLFGYCLSIDPSVIELRCTEKIMLVTLKRTSTFNGVIYAGDTNRDCRLNGKGASTLEMVLPTGQCGIIAVPAQTDGSKLAYRIRLYVQHHPLLQRNTDEVLVRECIPSNDMTLETSESARHNGDVQVIAPAWMEIIRGSRKDGPKISKSVLVGETVTIVVRSSVKENQDALVTKCYASDGTGAEPEMLIGDDGCPIDAAVVPAFTKEKDPNNPGQIIHWTKFPAFKFPDRNRLYLNCQLVFCDNACQMPRCPGSRFVRQSVDNNGDVWRKAKVVNSADVVNSMNVVNNNLEAPNDPFALEETSSDGKQCFPLKGLMTAIGILAAILLIAILLAIFFWWNRRQRKRQQVEGSYATTSNYHPGSNYYYMDQYPDSHSQQYSSNGNGRTPSRSRHYESHT